MPEAHAVAVPAARAVAEAYADGITVAVTHQALGGRGRQRGRLGVDGEAEGQQGAEG